MYNRDYEVDTLLNQVRDRYDYASQRAVINVAVIEAYNAGWNECYTQCGADMEKYLGIKAEYEALQTKYRTLDTEFADWKRIWEVDKIHDRLETYTEGYRERAEALMDAQAKVLKYDRLKQDYDLLDKRYATTVKAAQTNALQASDNLARAEAAEERIADIIRVIFPEQFENGLETDG